MDHTDNTKLAPYWFVWRVTGKINRLDHGLNTNGKTIIIAKVVLSLYIKVLGPGPDPRGSEH